MSDRNWDYVDDPKALAAELDDEIEQARAEIASLRAKIDDLLATPTGAWLARHEQLAINLIHGAASLYAHVAQDLDWRDAAEDWLARAKPILCRTVPKELDNDPVLTPQKRERL